MKPSQVASILRKIANGIENSKNPDKELVLKAIKRVSSKLEIPPNWREVQKKYEKVLYPGAPSESYWDMEQGSEQADEQGSSIWWWAFESAGIVDWTPVTDVEEVIKDFTSDPRTKGLVGDMSDYVKEIRKNYNEYIEVYAPIDIRELNHKLQFE